MMYLFIFLITMAHRSIRLFYIFTHYLHIIGTYNIMRTIKGLQHIYQLRTIYYSNELPNKFFPITFKKNYTLGRRT